MPSHLYLYRLCAQSVECAGGAGDGEVTERSTHLPRKFCKLSQYSEHKYRFFYMFAASLRPTTSHAAAHGFCGSVQFIHFAPHSVLHLLLYFYYFFRARLFYGLASLCFLYIFVVV